MKQFKMVDLIIIGGVILALIVGALTFTHFRQTASKQIEATSKIGFQVFLRGVTLTKPQSPIQKGDKTFVTIRNVPYTNLEVLDVIMDNKKVLLPSSKTKEPFVIMNDFSQPCLYDMIVTVVDTAKITKDGMVVGGNKIKIGLPITLEGQNYKLNGIVSDVQVLTEPKEQPKANDNVPSSMEKIPQEGQKDNNVG